MKGGCAKIGSPPFLNIHFSLFTSLFSLLSLHFKMIPPFGCITTLASPFMSTFSWAFTA